MAQPTRTPKMKKLTLRNEAAGITLTLLGPIHTDADRRRVREDELFGPVTAVLRGKSGNTLFFAESAPKRMRVEVGEYLAHKDAGEHRFNVFTADVVDAIFDVDSPWELQR